LAPPPLALEHRLHLRRPAGSVGAGDARTSGSSTAATIGHCPVTHLWDHSHYRDGSGVYVLRRDVEPRARRTGWHWCKNCKAVFYLGQGESGSGRCPNDPSGLGIHSQGDLEVAPGGQAWVSFRMETEEANNGPGTQVGWRFCFKCNGMFFVGNGLSATHCSAGGQHDGSRSWHYVMRFG
jgi:hypothetical protein